VTRNDEAKEELEAKSKIVVEWMQELLKEPIVGDTLQDKLSDGVVLCKVVNALKPGCVRNFHRKPKLLMMKMENIGFFLSICKSRFNVPQNSLFSPQDVQEKREDHANMLRVLTVLMLLIKEAGYNLAGLEKLPEIGDTPDISKTNNTPIVEEELNPDDLLSPRDNTKETENGVYTKNFDKSTKTTSNKGLWYIRGNVNEYVNIQQEVTAEILQCIHRELSIESKLVLLGDVIRHNDVIEEKLLYASDNDLRKLCFEMGLGSSLDDVPQNKERRWYVEWIIKNGKF